MSGGMGNHDLKQLGTQYTGLGLAPIREDRNSWGENLPNICFWAGTRNHINVEAEPHIVPGSISEDLHIHLNQISEREHVRTPTGDIDGPDNLARENPYRRLIRNSKPFRCCVNWERVFETEGKPL